MALVGAALSPALVVRGAEAHPMADPARFIFVIEKSERTRPLAAEVTQTLFDLVYRGANGHMPDGSVFEIWTFAEETAFRGFVPEMLTPTNRLKLASSAAAYLRGAPGRGQANVAKLVEHVRGASDLSSELTFILVTATETRLSGTSHDTEINRVFEANAENLRSLHRPFITTIRVQDRKIVGYSVSESAFSVTMPAMPDSLLTPEQRAQLLSEARLALAERERAAAPVKVEPAKNPNRNVADEDREGAIIIRGQPRKNPAPTAAPTGEAKPPAVAESTPVATPKPTDPPVVEAARPVDSESPKATEVESPASGTSSPAAAAIAPASSISPVTPPAHPEDARPDDGRAKTSVAASSNSVPVTALAVPAKTWFTAGGLFVAGLCFFVVAALLGWVLVRRARNTGGPSYITRSISDRR